MKTILLVDDEEHHHRLARRFWRCHRVLDAYNAADALAILSRIRVDLLLLDLQLPDMDGFQLIRTFRRDAPEALVHPPTIVWSADARRENVTRAAALNVRFVPKVASAYTTIANAVRSVFREAS